MSRFAWLRAIRLRLRPTDAATTFVEIQPPASVPSSITFTLPGTLPGATNALTVATDGTMGYQALGGGGTVSSFSAAPTALFDVVTPTTTPALSLKSQAANLFLASPNGSAGVPGMRAVVFGDLSSLVGTGANTLAAGNDSRFHTQGTDSGTTQASFQLNSGASGARLKDAAGTIQIRNAADSANADLSAANLTLSGNLTVQGTTTTIEAETMTINDNLIVLNNNVTSGTPTENGGVEIRRGASASAQLLWDETADQWFAGIIGSLRRIGFSGEQTFVNGDLTASVYTWNHGLGVQYFPVTVIDNTGKTVGVEITYVSSTQLTADFTGFGTLTGTWRLAY